MKKCYVIAVVGSGGKTSLIHHFSRRLRDSGKKTVVLTTTHMWIPQEHVVCDDAERALSQLNSDRLVYYGRTEDTPAGKKLIFPGQKDYETLCAAADLVLLEADGSKCLPLKCPDWSFEPVIPANVDAVFVVCGLSALGRPLEEVCHRPELAVELLRKQEEKREEKLEEKQVEKHSGTEPVTVRSLVTVKTAVTADRMETLLYYGYFKPLAFRFPNALISLFLNQADTADLIAVGNQILNAFRKKGMEGKLTCFRDGCLSTGLKQETEQESGQLPTISVIFLASGFGSRFGANKLLENLDGKPLYRHGLDRFMGLQRDQEQKRAQDRSWSLTNILLVSQYRELLEAGRSLGILTVENRSASQGISASVRLGTAAAAEGATEGAAKGEQKTPDYYLFSVADQPWMQQETIERFLNAFFTSGKTIGCMVSAGNSGNPAIFHRKYKEELLALTGDSGAGRLRKLHREEVFEFEVPEEELRDVDLKKDLKG